MPNIKTTKRKEKPEDKVCECAACGKTFAAAKNYKAHYAEFHAQIVVVYQCPKCNEFSSLRRGNLTRHQQQCLDKGEARGVTRIEMPREKYEEQQQKKLSKELLSDEDSDASQATQGSVGSRTRNKS